MLKSKFMTWGACALAFVLVFGKLSVGVAETLADELSVSAGEDEASTSVIEAPRPEGEKASKIIGFFELRPSYTSRVGEVHAENTIEGGYQFNKVVRLTYLQWFNNNVSNPLNGAAGASGLGLYASDGLFRLKANDFWVSEDKTRTLSYQGRLYMPTYSVKRNSGFITTVRNTLRIAQKLSDVVSVDFSAGPLFDIYTTPGSSGAANPAYEGVAVLNTDVHITKKLTFSMPVVFSWVKYRDYQEGAALNNQWLHFYYVWPELDWDIAPNQQLGVAFYSDNLVKGDLSGVNIGSGLEKGVYQILWNVSI